MDINDYMSDFGNSLVRLCLFFVTAIFCIPALGANYERGYECFKENDYECALEQWKPLAEEGNHAAQYNLGWMYYNGKGVERDNSVAINWFLMSADNGNLDAHYFIGFIYANGDVEGERYEKAVLWFRSGAIRGHAIAQDTLGWLYYYGMGVDRDDKEAVRWFRRAADQGLAVSMFNLGWMALINKNETKALKWYRLAAEQGNSEAQFHLGLLNQSGLGLVLKRDLVKSLKWYQQAAAQGNAQAQFELGASSWGKVPGQADERIMPDSVHLTWLALAQRNGHHRARREIRLFTDNLPRLEVVKPVITVQAEGTEDSMAVTTANARDQLYLLDTVGNWYQIYAPRGKLVGFVRGVQVKHLEGTDADERTPGPLPPPPEMTPLCHTRCFNGDCYRAWWVGEQINFQYGERYSFPSSRSYSHC